jgi:hypothetical protein
VSVRIEENDLAGCTEGNFEVPVELTLHLGLLVAETSFELISRNMVHVSWRDGGCQMELIEGIVGEGQLLEIGNLDLDGLPRRNVAHSKVEDVLAFSVNLSIGCLPALLDGLLVFLLGLFFLLDDALNPCLSELRHKSIDACLRVDWKIVLHFQKLVGRVVILLSESDIGDGIGNLKLILR